MRSRFSKMVIASSLMVAMFIMLNPASAASGYHMNGQGTLSIAGGGLPVCYGLGGSCGNADTTFSWGELTVQAGGMLSNIAVAGTYSCASQGTIGGVPFESRIYGNTTNFALTFNFRCTRDPGQPNNTVLNPPVINGWFSNVNSNLGNSNYRNVSGHEYGIPARPGAPLFLGYFSASDTHPQNITSSTGQAMACGGGFAPNNANQTSSVSTAAFMGACSAVDS